MKTKFLAGLIATLISLVTVLALALFLTLVIEVNPSKNWFTTTAAFLTIGSWLAVYKWLKPKDPNVKIEKDKYGFDIDPGVELIDDTAFKTTYFKTARGIFRVGIFFTVTCLPGAICVLIFSEDLLETTSLIGLIVLLLFGAMGITLIVKGIKKKASIMDGTDPLMNAINNNISDYVVWFHGYITQQRGTNIKELQSRQIIIYSQNMKKAVNMPVKSEKAYNEIMLFLESKFPAAETSYDAETKKRMKAKYGFKGLM